MNYKEKTNLAKYYRDQLEMEPTNAEIKNELLKNGVKTYDIKKIRNSAQKSIQDSYVSKTIDYLLNGELENHLDEFPLLDQDGFEKIQLTAVKKIKAKTDAKVSLLLEQKTPEEEVYDMVANPYYNIEDFEKQCNKYEYFNDPSKSNVNYIYNGIGSILLGILNLTMNTHSESSILICVSFITVGIGLFYKSRQTQSDFDEAKKEGYFNWFK